MTPLPLLMLLSALSARAQTTEPSAASRPDGPRNVAILLYEGVELLDFAGPGEIFAAARTAQDAPAFNVYTVAESRSPILSEGFLTIIPQYSLARCPRPDILVLPGGNANVPLGSSTVMEWVRRTAPQCEIAMSVCNGAHLLAQAGQLNSLRVTTHHGAMARLRTFVPSATVIENVRFVDNGRIVTTAGVSAGIDGALHVVDRLVGRAAATQTARYMEYEWRPDRP